MKSAVDSGAPGWAGGLPAWLLWAPLGLPRRFGCPNGRLCKVCGRFWGALPGWLAGWLAGCSGRPWACQGDLDAQTDVFCEDCGRFWGAVPGWLSGCLVPYPCPCPRPRPCPYPYPCLTFTLTLSFAFLALALLAGSGVPGRFCVPGCLRAFSWLLQRGSWRLLAL